MYDELFTFFVYFDILCLGSFLFLKFQEIEELKDDIIYLNIFKDKTVKVSEKNELLTIENKELKDENTYLTNFKDEIVEVSKRNEKLSIKNKSLNRENIEIKDRIARIKIENNELTDRIKNVEEVKNNKIKTQLQIDTMIKKNSSLLIENNELIVERDKLKVDVIKLTDKVINNEENMKTYPFFENKFGTGPIRFSKNGLYYHGLYSKKDKKYKWFEKGDCGDGYFWKYGNQKTKLPNANWDTYDEVSFCKSCSEVKTNKRINKIFICGSHSY